MSATDSLARELIEAYANRQILPSPLSARDPVFDLSSAYAVEAELVRIRRLAGRATVGRKVGYANKAVWRALKLETLVWAHMYDDTVRFAAGNTASLDIGRMYSPKIEPEIVFKLGSGMRGCGCCAGCGRVDRPWLRNHRLPVRGLEVPAIRFRRRVRPACCAHRRRAAAG